MRLSGDWEANEASQNHIFESVSIYLGCGFDDKLREYLRRIIRLGGGTFMNNFCSIVTHYIVSSDQLLPEDSDLYNQFGKKVICDFVSYRWLSECFLQRKLLDTKDFLLETSKENLNSNFKIKREFEEKKLIPKPKNERKNSLKLFESFAFRISGFSNDEVVFC